MQTLSLTKNETASLLEVPEGDHIVARLTGREDGPTLMVFGSIHGNEQSGLKALRSVASVLERQNEKTPGHIYLLAGNTRAINKNTRYINSDLNRHWIPENIRRNHPQSQTSTNRAEDIEQRELLAIIEEAVSRAKNEVYALDLHSTSSESTPFAMVGDTMRNRTFAEMFPATFLLGIEEQLDGTIMEYMNDLGAVTLGFEAGQHTTSAAVRNQEALIWLAMVNSGVLKMSSGEIEMHEKFLANAIGPKRIIEIRHRHKVTGADGFEMEPGYTNFQPISKGELLAEDDNGQIRAVEKGMILMPLYQKQGDDGFFIGREVASFWLKLSRMLRQTNVSRWMSWLPGVNRHPENEDALVVNTRVARFLPLQIFHLLGFRKRRWRNEKLVVIRRKHDTKSPFVSTK